MLEFFFFIGVLVGVVGVVDEYRCSRKRTATAQGKVLRVRFGRMHLGTNVRRPEIEFFDSRGQRHEFHSRQGGSPNPWPVGSTVEVFYDPDDPSNAEIAITLETTLFFGVIGAVFLGAAVYLLLRK